MLTSHDQTAGPQGTPRTLIGPCATFWSGTAPTAYSRVRIVISAGPYNQSQTIAHQIPYPPITLPYPTLPQK